jgi:hypothetical protein
LTVVAAQLGLQISQMNLCSTHRKSKEWREEVLRKDDDGLARSRRPIGRIGVGRGSVAMSYYAEYSALQQIIEKDRKKGLTKAESALEADLLEELGIIED